MGSQKPCQRSGRSLYRRKRNGCAPGLHEREFLDTFRFTTSSALPVHRNVSVHMLNLVDGTRAVLRSKSDAFPPLELHYAETCIVPQAAGDYEISSPDGSEVKVILACVRN